MANRFRFVVEVECERTEGKFASRDEIAEQLQEALDSANPQSIDGIGADGTTSYEVSDWAVEEELTGKAAKAKAKQERNLTAALADIRRQRGLPV